MMQTAVKTETRQQAVAAAVVGKPSSPLASGPVAIAPELLQHIGGGKAVSRQADAAAPVNKW